MAEPATDHLLLSLSHGPIPSTLLDLLIDETATECNATLESISESRNKNPENDYDKQRNTMFHIMSTGTPYIIKPGKSQPDYVHQWTKGEVILARLIEKIGMNKFHRVPKDGETKLAGRLIDVKPSDFELHSNRWKDNSVMQKETKENNIESDVKKKEDTLLEELKWIANNIFRMLVIDRRPNIGNATVLYPFDSTRVEGDDGSQQKKCEDNILQLVQNVFQKQWSDVQGPLHRANVEVKLVKNQRE